MEKDKLEHSQLSKLNLLENNELENGIILCYFPKSFPLHCLIIFYLYEFMMEKEDAQT